jgi:hypothetical protein
VLLGLLAVMTNNSSEISTSSGDRLVPKTNGSYRPDRALPT